MTDFAEARTIMVDRQVRPSDVTSFPIIDAMLRIPRERFTPPGQQNVAYAETPIALGGGREMLEPRVFAKMLDGARIGPDDLVLDLAPGLGYSTAIIAAMAAAVIAVEPDEAMAASAIAAVEALEVDNAMVRHGDPTEGDAAHGPFDAIFINGGVRETPKALAAQLKEGGRLVAIDMSTGGGRAVAYTRVGDQLQPRRLFDATAPVLPGFDVDEAFTL